MIKSGWKARAGPPGFNHAPRDPIYISRLETPRPQGYALVGMSTVAEIEAALRNLSSDDLKRIESALRRQYDERSQEQHLPRIRTPRLAHPEQAADFKKTLVINAKV